MRLLFLLFVLLYFLKPLNAKELRIAVIDSGFKYTSAKKCGDIHDVADGSYTEYNRHGSDVTDVIAQNISVSHCFVLIDIEDKNGMTSLISMYKAYKVILDQKVDIVNISLQDERKDYIEKFFMEQVLDSKIIVVVSAGNYGIKGKCITYPACYDDRIVIASDKHPKANDSNKVDFYADGNYKGRWGTSFSAPRVTAYIANNYKKMKEEIYGKSK